MNRNDFLKKGVGLVGSIALIPSLLSSKPYMRGLDVLDDCDTTNSETAGPFPTQSPENFEITNIVGDRTGIALTMYIAINNVNANCSALEGAIVDIWHCDKDGNYSQYGGTGMQSTNYTNNDFLRGRQVTDTNGQVAFTSIFPGWYNGRATHIHVHIYDETGSSLLVTQIAFPESTNSAVVQVNSATAYGYTKGMNGYTYNSNDNVFSDGVTNEMSTITGSISGGFTLSHTIFVNGPTLGISDYEDNQFSLSEIYPNPMVNSATVPITLKYSSDIIIQVYDISGRIVNSIKYTQLSPGLNSLTINRENLASGVYILKIGVNNTYGSFETSKKLYVK